MENSKNKLIHRLSLLKAQFKKRKFPSVHFVSEHWASVFFAAALSLILEHFGMLKLLAKFSIIVVSSMAAQSPSQPVAIEPDTAVVVLLGSADFVSRYGERSPLDRCEMALDIGRILKKSTAPNRGGF